MAKIGLLEKVRKFIKKFVVMAVFFIIFAEALLQLMAGAVFLISKGQRDRDASENKKNDFIVLCLGDSYTYGVGAGVSLSYPAQLEKVVNESHPSSGVRVINYGVPGMNSSTLALNFSKYLDEIKPSIVLVCIGRNDNWNMENVNFDDLKIQKNNLFYLNKASSVLIHSRLYKLFRYFTRRNLLLSRKPPIYFLRSIFKEKEAYAEVESGININEMLNKAREAFNAHDYSNSMNIVRSVRERALDTKDPLLITKMGFLYCDLDDKPEAVKLFTTALSYDKDIADAYRGRGESYFWLGDNNKATEDFNKAIQLYSPDDISLAWIYRRKALLEVNRGDKAEACRNLKKAFSYDHDFKGTLPFLMVCFSSNNDRHMLIETMKELIDQDGTNPAAIQYKRYIDYLSEKREDLDRDVGFGSEFVDEVLRINLNRMFLEAGSRNVAMYYMNYPSPGSVPTRNTDIFINTFWQGHLIDVGEEFNSFWKGPEHNEYFIFDGHCTAKGYYLMAKVVFKAIDKFFYAEKGDKS